VSNVGLQTSIAVDFSGPHISYFDACGTLKYAYIQGTCTGSFWVTSALFSGDSNRPTAIALDSNSQPHILYIDSTGTNLMHAWVDSTDRTWKREIISSNIGYGGYGIAIDSNNCIHVTYPNNNNEYLMYACKDDAGWHHYTVDLSGDGVTNPSIVTDQNNIPRIAYGDYYKNLKYAWFDDPDWRITTVEENCFGEFPIMGTDIALDSEGYPHICYYGDGVNYAWYDGVGLNQETIDSEGAYASLALDSNGNPFISYYNKENAYLMGAVKEDSGWKYYDIDSEGNVGRYSSLAIDSNDTPHISYYDTDNPSLKYATSTYVTIALTDLTIDYSPSTVDKTVPDSVVINGELTSEGIGVEGKTIEVYWQDNAGDWIYIDDIVTEDSGSYSYTWTPTSDVPNGQHLLKAVFTGDDEYLGSEAQTEHDGLFVVPEYPFGCLLALLACFAALFVSKKGKLSVSKTI
jgi:hypothetical protein